MAKLLNPDAEEVNELRRQLQETRRSLAQEREKAERLRSREVPEAFQLIYYEAGARGGTWQNTYWMGTPVLKVPLDLWVYQEILYETKPDLIIETGTADGGSALYLASICDLLGSGRVITIDVDERGPSGAERPKHPRASYMLGSSTDPTILKEVRNVAEEASRVMVILDSDHSKAHVLEELRAYAPLVSVGCYLVVEDTNINGHPVFPNFGPGPMEAVESFLAEKNGHFEVDRAKEKFLLTQNPSGYLKKVR